MGTVLERVSALGTSTVHVYAADLDTVGVETGVLSEDELERADRFRFERDRRRFVAARSVLRRMLARYVDTGPAAISFEYGQYGKPDVPGAPVSFNVSHSGSYALFAIGPRFELGVDVEVLDDARADDLLVAKQFFSLREIETQLLESGKGLRSKKPELVRQEFWGLLLAHYAIRTLMTEAAETADLDADRLSFIRTLNIVRRQVTNQAAFSPRNPELGTP